MNTSNTECTPLTKETFDNYIAAWNAESEYWTLPRKERNKIDAQRHKQGLPKYKMI